MHSIVVRNDAADKVAAAIVQLIGRPLERTTTGKQKTLITFWVPDTIVNQMIQSHLLRECAVPVVVSTGVSGSQVAGLDG